MIIILNICHQARLRQRRVSCDVMPIVRITPLFSTQDASEFASDHVERFAFFVAYLAPAGLGCEDSFEALSNSRVVHELTVSFFAFDQRVVDGLHVI